MNVPLYSKKNFPPMPPRIRLAAHCWERVWWLTLSESTAQPERLRDLLTQFETDTIKIRIQMRTQRRICFAVQTEELEEQSEFELAMTIMALINQEMGEIERVEDRPANMWPMDDFSIRCPQR